jgi:hypothetical protein
VLHIGNIKFEAEGAPARRGPPFSSAKFCHFDAESGDGCGIVGSDAVTSLERAASLLGLDPVVLASALCARQMMVGSSSISKTQTVDEVCTPSPTCVYLRPQKIGMDFIHSV